VPLYLDNDIQCSKTMNISPYTVRFKPTSFTITVQHIQVIIYNIVIMTDDSVSLNASIEPSNNQYKILSAISNGALRRRPGDCLSLVKDRVDGVKAEYAR